MGQKHVRIVVVLPEPLGPRKPCMPPTGTRRSSPSTAACLPFRAIHLAQAVRLDAQSTMGGATTARRRAPAADLSGSGRANCNPCGVVSGAEPISGDWT